MVETVLLKKLLNIPYEKIAEEIASFIKGFIIGANVKGAVLGVSGGVDSATTLAITVKAIGSEKVTALIMPDRTSTPKADVEDALYLVKTFKVKRYYLMEINDVVNSLTKTMKGLYDPDDLIALGNIKARVRMIMLYYVANRFNLAVIGSGDRSEIMIGYFTKYGDGAVDVLPLGGLYKSQVRELAKHLGIPHRIAYKPSSPRLWPGQTAEDELKVDYTVIDQVLYGVFDLHMKPEEVAKEVNVPLDVVEDILLRVKRTEHKRRMPPIFRPASLQYIST